MVALVGLLCIASFLVAFISFDIIGAAAKSFGVFRTAIYALLQPELDDHQKELVLREASVCSMKILLSVLSRTLLSLCISAVPLIFFVGLGLVSINDVGNFLTRVDVIILTTILMFAIYVVWRRLWRTK